MKKLLLFIYSFSISASTTTLPIKEKNSILEILKTSKVPIKSETSDEGGRTTEGGGGNGGRPKTQK